MKAFRSLFSRLFALLLVLTVLAPAVVPAPAYASAFTQGTPTVIPPQSFACTYVVRAGDDLFKLGLRFGVPYLTLAAENNLANYNLLFVGTVLRVPCTGQPASPVAGTVCNIHIVQRGEWLNLIAQRYGVSWQSIAALNHLANPNALYVGQRLLIPCRPGGLSHTIIITGPFAGKAVCTPVTTTGWVSVSPFESALRGRVYNAQGSVVGTASIHVNAPMGKPGTFSGSIPVDTGQVMNGSTGRVEVAETSPRDGSVIASASVNVRFSCGK